MLSEEERKSRLPRLNDPIHILQMFKERGTRLFGSNLAKEMVKESFDHIYDSRRSVIIPDERNDPMIKSTHIAIFLSDAAKIVAIPCEIGDRHITICTLKDVERDQNPNWYISKYNEKAEQKGLKRLDYLHRINHTT